MRLDQLINEITPKQQIPNNLPDLYELEDDPDSEMHKDLENLYNPKRTTA